MLILHPRQISCAAYLVINNKEEKYKETKTNFENAWLGVVQLKFETGGVLKHILNKPIQILEHFPYLAKP